MPAIASEKELTLPEEMLSFVLRHGEHSQAGQRLGQLALRGRPSIATPTFAAPTSRGVIPHITPDVLSKLTRVPAVYVGLEDFIEKIPSEAPLFRQDIIVSKSRLRDFISLPSDCISILGPRRIPSLKTPKENSNSAIAICTSVGFQSLDVAEYARCIRQLDTDISVSVADVVLATQISQKRIERSADRTHAWTRDALAARAETDIGHGSLFASVPPLQPHQQSFYLADLSNQYKSDVAGVTLYTAESATYLPESVRNLPRLCITAPENPHEILRTVALGSDLITVPLVTATSENGVAMTFSLSDIPDDHNQPLGFDLWDTSHAADVSPLVNDCTCYTCTKHHRAYLHHLLNAKEMLAWTLLQIHNFHILDGFFGEIRGSISDGTFDEKCKAFSLAYNAEMPQPTGEGPRVRGYQMKSVGGGESRKNKKAYGRLDEHARKLEEADSGVAAPEAETTAGNLEKQGLGKIEA